MPASSVLVRSTAAAMLPAVWTMDRLWSTPTVAPASSAVWMAERPDSPAPTTTTSYSCVSANPVMSAGFCRKLGPS